MGDKIWIEEQRELFNRTFNIGKRSKTKQSIDLEELNLPSSEDKNMKVKEKFPEIFVKSEEFSETSIKSESYIDESESYSELPSDLSVKNEDPLKVHEEKCFPCSDCDFSTKLKSNLTKHILEVHGSIKVFSCESCNEIFSNKRSLTIHIDSVHEKKKLFQCPHCDLGYAEKG